MLLIKKSNAFEDKTKTHFWYLAFVCIIIVHCLGFFFFIIQPTLSSNNSPPHTPHYFLNHFSPQKRYQSLSHITSNYPKVLYCMSPRGFMLYYIYIYRLINLVFIQFLKVPCDKNTGNIPVLWQTTIFLTVYHYLSMTKLSISVYVLQ